MVLVFTYRSAELVCYQMVPMFIAVCWLRVRVVRR
jgi:hypothetical protein